MTRREQISVNHLVTSAMPRYREWEVYAEKFDLVTSSGTALTVLLKKLSDQEARELGRDMGIM